MAACCTLTVTAWPGSSLGALSHPTEGDLLLHDDRRWALQRCMHALGAHARLRALAVHARAHVLPCRCAVVHVTRAAQLDQRRSRSLCVAFWLQGP